MKDHAGGEAADRTSLNPESPAKDATLPEDDSIHLPPEYDRRGIPLPLRHKVGGIITPQ